MNLKTSKQIFNLNFIKMKKLLFYVVIAFAILSSSSMMAQQGFGTNTPDKSAAVDIVSTKRGMLIPRVALTETADNSPVNAPATSLMIYNTATVNDVTPGFYYWDGAKWVRFMDTDSNHTTSVVQGQGIIVEADTTDPNHTAYTVSVAPGASEEMVMVTIEDPLNPGEFITEWVSYADFLDDLIAADNGLTYDETTGTIELGGALTRDTNIALGEFDMVFTMNPGTDPGQGGVLKLVGLQEIDVTALDLTPVTGADIDAYSVAIVKADGTVERIPLEDFIAQTTYTANNGLTMTDNNVQLGGNLIKPTVITTGVDADGNPLAANTLAIENLAPINDDSKSFIVVTDEDGVLHNVLRTIEATATGDWTVNSTNIPGYSSHVQEVNIEVDVQATDINITLPDAVAAKGQVINIRLVNNTENNGYCNILLPGGATLTYGSMPYQSWIIKSTGTNWAIVGRN